MTIPDEVRAELRPALSEPDEDVPKIALPCGLALKLTRGDEDVT